MKPGLYVATVRGVTGFREEDVRVICAPSDSDSLSWRRVVDAPDEVDWLEDSDVTDARPLVVLDLESDEDTGRMADALAAEKRTPGWHETSRRVLRALAAPTPAEPMGLGAVVRDRAGWLWVKWSTAHRDDRNWKHESHSGEYRRWSDIDSPEVLSEGWSE